MTPTEVPSTPALPIPIFQVSQKIDRYMLYDINVITWLRQAHNILGVLIGSLPQVPQQNVFLGLPLELQPEEARLLVDLGVAFVVDDRHWHASDLVAKDAVQLQAIRRDLYRQGVKIAKGFEQSKHDRNQKALERRRDKNEHGRNKGSSAACTLKTEDSTSEETLFDDSPSQDTSIAQSSTSPEPQDSELKSWSITPTTSYPPLSKPTEQSPPILPTVNPSSYALFSHLHNLGYFMTPGIRFGCQFSVYPGDPLRFHSHFLAMSYEWDEEIDLLDLVGGGRLGTGVKKGWLLGGREEGKGDEDGGEVGAIVRTFCIEWGGM